METENTTLSLTAQQYLKLAETYYTDLIPRLTNADQKENAYWVRGCILESVVDFLLLAGRYDIIPYSKGNKFLEVAGFVYLSNQYQGAWYDDWMWWGNTTSRVYDPAYRDLFAGNANLKEYFMKICAQTFTFVRSGKAPYAPLNPAYVGTLNAFEYVKQKAAVDPARWRQFAKDVEPRWNIGCWQGPMTPDHDFNPLELSLGPFQDSVVNGLFYIFAQRTQHQPGYGTQKDIDDMTTFYNNWNEPALPADRRLFNRVSPESGLFRERVSVYKNGMAINGYEADLAWSGDQGLMLAALTSLYLTQPGTQKLETLATIKSIINGVIQHATGDINQTYQNVIMPWCHLDLPASQQPGNAPGSDPGDYFSGTGIFMRGLLEASKIPEVKALIGTANVQQVLQNTLDALLDKDANNKDTNIYMNFVFNYNPPPSTEAHEWFNDFNKMAALLVASQLMAKN
jgi:hypothetical protein